MRNADVYLKALFIVPLLAAVILLVAGPKSTTAAPQPFGPKNELAFTGVVQAVDDFDCPLSSGSRGSHLVLTTGAGAVIVHVGPEAAINIPRLNLSRGKGVQVFGWKAEIAGTETLIAREIAWDDERLILRGASGRGMWERQAH